MEGLTLLKFLAGLATVALGVCGVYFDPHDDRKKIARWFLVGLIIVAAVIGFTIDSYQERKQRDDATVLFKIEKLQEQSNTVASGISKVTDDIRTITGVIQKNTDDTSALVANVDRVLSPLQDIRVTYRINVAPNHSEIVEYLKRLIIDLDPYIRSKPAMGTTQPAFVMERDIQGNPLSIAIGASSTYLPRPEEKVLHALLDFTQLDLHLFRKTVSCSETEVFGGPTASDLALIVNTSFDANGLSGQHVLRFETHSQSLSVAANDVRVDRRLQRRSGRIIGVSDLRSAQLVIVLRERTSTGDKDLDVKVNQMRNALELADLMIDFGENHKFEIKKPGLSKVGEDQYQDPVYCYRFPDQVQSLYALRDQAGIN